MYANGQNVSETSSGTNYNSRQTRERDHQLSQKSSSVGVVVSSSGVSTGQSRGHSSNVNSPIVNSNCDSLNSSKETNRAPLKLEEASPPPVSSSSHSRNTSVNTVNSSSNGGGHTPAEKGNGASNDSNNNNGDTLNSWSGSCIYRCSITSSSSDSRRYLYNGLDVPKCERNGHHSLNIKEDLVNDLTTASSNSSHLLAFKDRFTGCSGSAFHVNVPLTSTSSNPNSHLSYHHTASTENNNGELSHSYFSFVNGMCSFICSNLCKLLLPPA